jgi:prepilin-type N-terminal cleavage/methylation domain-containing protein
MMRLTRGGFTIVELLTVIVIVAVLAALAIPRFVHARERAFYATMISDLNALQNMQEIYYHNGAFAYKTSGTIAATASDPDLHMQTSQDVTIALGTHANGWAATATHMSLPGEECNVFFGDAGTVGQATSPGEIKCSG